MAYPESPGDGITQTRLVNTNPRLESTKMIELRSTENATLKKALVEKAFDRVMRPAYAPEPVKPLLDYNMANICPYCREPMIVTKVRTATTDEQVYMCPTDRAVGCMPD